MSVSALDSLKQSTHSAENGRDHLTSEIGSRLVIIGGGMAGYGLCDRLVRSGAHERYQVTIIGDEPQPAYDRVNLSKFFSGRTADELLLATRQWYEDHSIELSTGRRVVDVKTDERMVVDDQGEVVQYDQLVFATGSSAFVPPIPGADTPGVFVYRTISDLESIKQYCEDRNASVGAVLGGGLLGIEAAKVLMDLGIQVSIVEMAPGLMPRQLDSDAAGLLKQKIEKMGVDIHLVRRTESIQSEPDTGKLTLKFSNADDLLVDVIIIAAGVRPRDEVAKKAGLDIGPRGGIVVQTDLQTSDPNIFAIGECASFEDHVYGLAAPCFRMADVLAQRLDGLDARFEGADESAELKLLGVQVATLGRTIGESPGGRVLTHHSDHGYRKLLIENGRLVGASCVGDWDELPQIRGAIQKTARLWPWQTRRFGRTGSPWTPGGAIPVGRWPDEATICSCLLVTKATIKSCIADGHTETEQIANQCGASTACGSCRPLVAELAGQPKIAIPVPGRKTMLATSLVGLLMGCIWIFASPVPMATSVQSAWRDIDILWRDDTARQISGFTLLGLTLLGMVFSLRKRWPRFQFGSYGFWRAAHGVLGTAVMIGVAVHTGLRLGHNLNLVLGVCFLLVAFLGAFAGIASSLEAQLDGRVGMLIRRWRPRLTQIHLWITWPLPALIGLHILSFYWFSD